MGWLLLSPTIVWSYGQTGRQTYQRERQADRQSCMDRGVTCVGWLLLELRTDRQTDIPKGKTDRQTELQGQRGHLSGMAPPVLHQGLELRTDRQTDRATGTEGSPEWGGSSCRPP